MNMHTLLPRLARLARLARRNAYRLIPSEPLRRAEPVPPPPTPAMHLRLHLFGASFDTPQAARDFCFVPPGPDLPVPLNQELTGAYIDNTQVEVVTDPILPRLLEFLEEPDAQDIILRLAADNTLIIITEAAFGGLPFDLDDTDRLTYLGAQLVEI